MSKDSKQTTDSRSVQLPKAPEYIRNGVEGLTGAILNLGNRNPQDYVPGASPLQQQAFGMASNIAQRYGAQPSYQQPYMQGGGGQPVQVGGGNSGGGGLFDSLGVRTPEHFNYDYQAIAADRANREPAFQQAFDSLTPQQHRDIAEVMGLPDQAITMADFARFHQERGPQISQDMEDRFRQLSGGKTSNPFGGSGTTDMVYMGDGRWGPSANGTAGPISYTGQTQPGPTKFNSQIANPLDMYRDSAGLARGAATAGANTYNPSMIDAQGAYDAAMNAASGVSAGSTRAHSLLTNLEKYMSPYTNDVVNTTLANSDENDARQLAQAKAEAAGNGAFGGSRYGIMDAVLRGEHSRNRAATEAGLRDAAFNTGAGLSADDANRRQSASNLNAQLATQANLARQQAELQRASLMFAGAQSDQNAMNSAGQFNAGQAERALDRALRGADSLRATGNTQETNERAALGLLGELGGQQRQIAGQVAGADVGLLGTIMQYAQALGLDVSQVTGIVNNGTQTTSTTPGLLDYWGAFNDTLSAVNQG